MRNSWTLCWLCLLLSEAAWAEAPPELDRRIFPSDLVWSLGFKLNMDRMSHPREVDPGLMLGLRYGRWRTGAVDGESWHRFGQVKTDNTLTYDLNDASHFRTSLSASVVTWTTNRVLTCSNRAEKPCAAAPPSTTWAGRTGA